MSHTEGPLRIVTIPDATLQQAMAEQPVADPPYQVNPNLALDPPVQQGDHRKRHTLAKLAVGAALVSTIFLGGEQQAEAEAAPAATTSDQAPAPESSSDWLLRGSLAIGAAGLLTTTVLQIRAMTRQTRESTENRYAATLEGIKGESGGEERVLRLGALQAYADRKDYAPKVFRAARAYLRGRRGGLDTLRKEYKINTEEADVAGFEHAITERRYGDREGLKLLTQTLPAARKKLRWTGLATHIKRLFGADELYKLDKQTGTTPAEAKPRVNARGLNIDFMRGVKRYDFRNTDLTGAGMQGNQFASVIFRNARLCEAQFEGSTLYRCSFRDTDARAAYWYGAEIKECVVDKDTKLGNLPDNHPDAKFGALDPNNPEGYRGEPNVILKDLIPHKMSQQQFIEMIKEWQRNGLKLGAGSNREYFLNPADDPNYSEPPEPTAEA